MFDKNKNKFHTLADNGHVYNTHDQKCIQGVYELFWIFKLLRLA